MKRLSTLNEVMNNSGLALNHVAGLHLLCDQFVQGFQEAGVVLDLNTDVDQQGFGGYFWMVETTADVDELFEKVAIDEDCLIISDVSGYLDDDRQAGFLCCITNDAGGDVYILTSTAMKYSPYLAAGINKYLAELEMSDASDN